jgi:hypothetical protein
MSEFTIQILLSETHFGLLKGPKVSQMWKMLIDSNEAGLKIDTSNIKADDYIGSARWTAPIAS